MLQPYKPSQGFRSRALNRSISNALTIRSLWNSYSRKVIMPSSFKAVSNMQYEADRLQTMDPYASVPSFLVPEPLKAHGTEQSRGGENPTSAHPALVVFSGGTAFNTVAGQLRNFSSRVCHVLPVSDDGGSTAEIVRVLGGPAIGDIRSRCLRLADESDDEARSLKRLLRHRLSSTSLEAAKREWIEIVEGEHALWEGVSEAYKHVIRAFLIHFHEQILRHSTERFNFRNGSVGNFFFAGARHFFRSLEAAIFLFSRVARIQEGSQVLPCIRSEERIALAAELTDGSLIRGQHNISHPTAAGEDWKCGGDSCEDKSGLNTPLALAIRRLLYLGYSGGCNMEIFMPANPLVLTELSRADAIVYGMGSLYTSLCPTLCLDGVGEVVASRPVPKILCLNGSIDRETSCALSHDGPMNAVDFVHAVADALNRRHFAPDRELRNPPSAYVTGVLVPSGGSVRVDVEALRAIGVSFVVEVDSFRDDEDRVVFKSASLVEQLENIYRMHLLVDETMDGNNGGSADVDGNDGGSADADVVDTDIAVRVSVGASVGGSVGTGESSSDGDADVGVVGADTEARSSPSDSQANSGEAVSSSSPSSFFPFSSDAARVVNSRRMNAVSGNGFNRKGEETGGLVSSRNSFVSPVSGSMRPSASAFASGNNGNGHGAPHNGHRGSLNGHSNSRSGTRDSNNISNNIIFDSSSNGNSNGNGDNNGNGNGNGNGSSNVGRLVGFASARGYSAPSRDAARRSAPSSKSSSPATSKEGGVAQGIKVDRGSVVKKKENGLKTRNDESRHGVDCIGGGMAAVRQQEEKQRHPSPPPPPPQQEQEQEQQLQLQ